jgi:hypothetical protein
MLIERQSVLCILLHDPKKGCSMSFPYTRVLSVD